MWAALPPSAPSPQCAGRANPSSLHAVDRIEAIEGNTRICHRPYQRWPKSYVMVMLARQICKCFVIYCNITFWSLILSKLFHLMSSNCTALLGHLFLKPYSIYHILSRSKWLKLKSERRYINTIISHVKPNRLSHTRASIDCILLHNWLRYINKIVRFNSV